MKENLLKDKSKAFALRIINLSKYMREAKSEYVMSKQILRSGTSIGANIAEAYFAQSNADLISKLSISQKEAGETCFWLEILYESDYISKKEFESMNCDLTEILKLLTTSIKTLKKNNP